MKLNAEVYQAESYDDVWQSLLKPWLLRTQLKPPGGMPSAVLLPYGSWEAHLKRSMVQESISGFNVSFLTPGKLRTLLDTAVGEMPSVRSSEAFNCVTAAQAHGSKIPYAKAIYNSPESFVRACDKVVIAGHDLTNFFTDDLKGFTQEWDEETRGLSSIQKNDRAALVSLLKGGEAIFDELFIAGFTGRDWGLFPLLLSSLCVAKKAHMYLPLVRDGLYEELWTGTWENLLGASVPIKGDAGLCEEPQAEFLLGKTVIAEAGRIAKRALLAAASGEETCIVVPGPGALSQEIAQQFEQHSIPYYDGLGGYSSLGPKGRLIGAWFAFMQEPRFGHFITFLREEKASQPEVLKKLEGILKRAHCDTLVDDFGLLKAHVFAHYSLTKDLRDLLERFSIPGAEGLFSDYWSRAEPFLKIGFEDAFTELGDEGILLSGLLSTPIPFRLFLSWIEEKWSKGSRVRTANANQPLSNIYLLSSEQADGLTFDTVILAGLNAGQWSGKSSSSLFEPEALIRSKNRWATIQGSQGEGHRAVRFPYGYILTEEDTFKEARARQERLACSARKVRVFSASIASDRDFKVNQPLDDCYQSFYNSTYGCYLGDAELSQVLEQTSKRIPSEVLPVSSDCEDTRKAYHVRRNDQSAFGPYEYAFSPSTHSGFKLSCSQWERSIKQPSGVWYRVLAGVQAEDETTIASVRSKARGIWVHHWLVFFRDNAQLKLLPDPDLWEACLGEKADEHYNNVSQSYVAVGQKIPDWWRAEWFRARFQACTLMRAVLEAEGFPFFAQELNLPESAHVDIGANCNIPLSGRMDLILSNQPGNLGEQEASAADLWVVDFKTGQQGALTLKKMEKGEGLQLALYAGALQQRDASPVGLSIFGMRGKSKERPQLTFDQAQSLQPIWDFMRTVNSGGIFGQRTQARSRFNPGGRFPIATLGIPQQVLDKKWQLSHPGFAPEN